MLTRSKSIVKKIKIKLSPDVDEIIGKKVKSFVDYLDKEYKITGVVVNKQGRTKGAGRVWYYKVRWNKMHQQKWNYKEHEYMKLNDLNAILVKG